MPRNPVNDVRAAGTLRFKASDAAGPADEFQSVTVINPAGVISLIGNQGSDRWALYGDGSLWTPVQPATPGTLVPGQYFIETSAGTEWWTYVDSLGVATHAAKAGSIVDTGITMNTNKLLGRSTAGVGAPEEITIGAGLTLVAGTLSTAAGGGTVTSVGLAMPAMFTVSGSPVTTSGTLTATLATQTANRLFAGPASGAVAAPTFRVAVPLDLALTPAAGQFLQATAGTTMAWNTMSGDATLNSSGVLTLVSTISAGGPTGDASTVPVITYDTQGRLTAVTTATITPAAIGAADAGLITASSLTMSTNMMLGRSTAGTGAVEEITVGAGLILSAGVLSAPGGSGTVTGTGAANQIAYWSAASAITGDSGLTYNGATNTLTTDVYLGAVGSLTNATFSFATDPNTGIYHVSADVLGFVAGGTSIMTASTTTVTINGKLTVTGLIDPTGLQLTQTPANPGTSDTIWIDSGNSSWTVHRRFLFTASTTAGASLNLPPGVAPTSPADGDMWVTTAGLFTQVNGGTVGPFSPADGSGTVTSVAMSVPSFLSVAGSPVTTSGTFAVTLATQTANLVFAGPASGSAATPTFRAHVPLDIAATPSSAQILQATSGTTMAWTTLSGDATISNAGVLTLTSTIVAGGPTGSASSVPVITYDAKGRLTVVTTAAITPAAIGAVPTGAVTTSGLTMTTARLLGRTTASTGAIEEITVGSGLSLSAGTLTASGGGTVTGTGVANQIAYWSGTSAIAGDTGLTFNDTTNVLTITGGVVLGDGALATPAVAFSSDPDSGIYYSGGPVIVVNATSKMEFSPSAITIRVPINGEDGSASAPIYAFSSNANLGFYRVSSQTIGLATSGVLRWSVDTTSVTSTLINILPASTTGAASMRLPHGTAPSAPTNGDVWTDTTGLFARINGATVAYGAGTVTGTGAANRMAYWSSASALTSSANLTYVSSSLTITGTGQTGGVRTNTGTAGIPAYSFIGATDTGMFAQTGPNELLFAVDGLSVVGMTSTWIEFGVTARAFDGTASSPGWAFITMTNAGFYKSAANTVGLSTGGTLRWSASTTLITSTLINIMPAAAAGAGGFASIRMPHGVDPTTNITNGDMWTTTTGLFARINGATVQFSTGGGSLTGSGAAGQVSYFTSSSAITSASTMTFDATTQSFAVTQTGAAGLSTDIQGVYGNTTRAPAVSGDGSMFGVRGTASLTGAGFAANSSQIAGGYFSATTVNTAVTALVLRGVSGTAENLSTGTVTSVIGGQFTANNTSSGTITNLYGAYISTLISGGTVTNHYGIYQDNAAAQNFFSGIIVAPTGTAGAPSFTFASDLDSGLYRLGANNIGISTGGAFRFGVSTTLIDLNLPTNVTGDLKIQGAGNGLYITEGSNATSGVATLVGGTVVVSTTKVTAVSRIQLTGQNLGTITVPVGLYVSARTPGASFTILSGNVADTSDIAWVIIEPT